MLTLPPFAFTEAAGSTASTVFSLTMLMASAPATPMSAPLAPEVAFAKKFARSAESTIAAERSTPFALTLSPVPIAARLRESARFKATATPTPYFAGLPLPAADPSAVASASVLAKEASLSGPPAVTFRLSPMVAAASLDVRLTPIAPARLIDAPELSFAAGAALPPVPVAPPSAA